MLFGRDRGATPPDFVGVGAEGTGASWWQGLLLRHPAIGGPPEPLHFFSAFCAREMTRDDVRRYHRAAGGGGEGAIRGEWSERYLADAWTPPLLLRAAPDARLLVMLADPIERFAQALGARLRTHAEGRRLVMADVADRANYATHLRRLRRAFDPERILVLQYERCLADPGGEYRRTLEFLGVDADVPPPADAAGSPPPSQRAELWPEIEAALHASLDPEVRELTGMVPGLDVSLWPNFASAAATA